MAEFTSSPLKWLSKLRLSRRRRRNPSPPSPSPNFHGFAEAFRKLDLNEDGRISSKELFYFLPSAREKVTKLEVERLVEEFDSDGDGLLDYFDFVRLLGGEDVEEDLTVVFEIFVGEKDGEFITTEGLRRVLRQMGERVSHDQCAAMIRAFDRDGDGAINYVEFCRMMT